MGGHAARGYWEDVGLVKLMLGVLLPPFAWFVDLQTSYALVKWACEHGRRGLLLTLPVGSLAIVGTAMWLSWSCWTKLRDEGDEDGGRREDRSYLLAVAGLAMSAVFALLILTTYAPRYLLSPCE
jgi:hypothetical protein